MTIPQLSLSPGRQRKPLQPVWVCGLALLLAGVPGFAQNQGSTAQGSPPPGSSTSQEQDTQNQGTTPQGTTTQGTTTQGTTTQGGTGVAGTWQGAIELPQAKLDITVDLAQKQDGTWTGAIDIPQQKAENLLLEPVMVNGNEVKFAIKGLPGDPTFEGKLENGEITGTFTQTPPIPFELNLNGPGSMGVGGNWQGAINLPQGPLQVVVDLTEANGAWTGTIDIPAQQAENLLLEPVTVNGSELTFAIKGVPGNPTFTGTVSGTKMTGEFKQGAPTPFRLARGTAQQGQGQQQGQASPPQSQ